MIFFRVLKRFTRGRSGTEAIEFAFVIIPLMLLMFGSIEVARLMWVQNAIHEIAISGARCMGVEAANCADTNGVDLAATKSYIRTLGQSRGLSIALSDITLSVTSGCGEPTGFSSVVIVHKFISVLTLLNGPNLTFEACFPNQN